MIAWISPSKGPTCARADSPFAPRQLGKMPPYFEVKITAHVPAESVEEEQAQKGAARDEQSQEEHTGAANRTPSPASSRATSKADVDPTISVGFAGEFCSLRNAHVGWSPWSVGQHGDDGLIFEENGTSTGSSTDTFGIGDTVGCGIDYHKGEYLFTRNGSVVGEFFLCFSERM